MSRSIGCDIFIVLTSTKPFLGFFHAQYRSTYYGERQRRWDELCARPPHRLRGPLSALISNADPAGVDLLEAEGEGRRFVVDVQGSPSNVIGLPLEETLELLDRASPSIRLSIRNGIR